MFFFSCLSPCDQGLIIVIVYYFQIWNKKEHNTIISWVIVSYMVPMYIETPYVIKTISFFVLLLYEMYWKTIEIEAVFTKMEVNNEWNVFFKMVFSAKLLETQDKSEPIRKNYEIIMIAVYPQHSEKHRHNYIIISFTQSSGYFL